MSDNKNPTKHRRNNTNNCGCGCYGNKNFLILDGKKTTLEINKKSEKKMI